MADVDIDFYCRAYDDFLSPADCEAYIDKYEETLRVDNERWKELSTCVMKDGGKNPTCGNCSCDRLGPMEFDRFRELNDKTDTQVAGKPWKGMLRLSDKSSSVAKNDWMGRTAYQKVQGE